MEATNPFDGTTAVAQRIGRRLRTWPPPIVAIVVGLVGYVLVTAVLIAFGLVITRLLTPGPVMRWDDGVSRWFARRRTPLWNDVTNIGSILAGTVAVLAVEGVALLILGLQRLWREMGFLVIAVVIEFVGFVTVEALVHRPRPPVSHLDALPVTSSFPSGHTAIAIAMYFGLAIVVVAHSRRPSIGAPAWTLAVILVVGVGLSRVYRGMHHSTDVIGGVVLGIGAILVATIAVRAADAVSRQRRRSFARGEHDRAPPGSAPSVPHAVVGRATSDRGGSTERPHTA